jgi:NitT/TauT family transport system permease protein
MSIAGKIRLVILVVAVGALEAACRLGYIEPFSVSAPTTMLASAFKILASGEFRVDILITLATVAVAAVLSIAVGFALGVLLYVSPRFKRAADPFLASYYAVPSFIFYPLFIVMFGLNRWPLVAVAFVFAFVAMAIATADGFLNVRPILRKVALSMSLSRAQTVRLILLPAAMPYLFTGIKLAIAYSFIGVIGGEFIQAGSGLGYRVAFAYQSFETGTMYGLLLILLVCVTGINMALSARERRLHQQLSR